MTEGTSNLSHSIRIRCLLLHCQPSLAALLQYLLDERIKDGSRQVEKLPALFRQKREVLQNFKYTTFIKYGRSTEIEPRRLDITELCEILKSKELGLLEPLECCNDWCQHGCLTCSKNRKCNEELKCYKTRCKGCGEESHSCLKETFMKSVSLVEELCLVLSISNRQLITDFFEQNRAFPTLPPNCKSWENLWRGIQKSMANILSFLCDRGAIRKGEWKDIDMEMRNVLKRSLSELNFLFDEKLNKFPSLSQTSREIDINQEREANRDRKQINSINDIQQSPTAAVVSLDREEYNHQYLTVDEENTAAELIRSRTSSVGSSSPTRLNQASPKCFGQRSFDGLKCSSDGFQRPSNSLQRTPEGLQPQSNIYMTLHGERDSTTPLYLQQSPPGNNHRFLSPQHTPSSKEDLSTEPFTTSLSSPSRPYSAGAQLSAGAPVSAHGRNLKYTSLPVESENTYDAEKPNFSMVSNIKKSPNIKNTLMYCEDDYAKYHQGKNLVLIRGLPGSGKTTLATKVTSGGGIILSTDDYFRDANGVYKFIAEKLTEAHSWNQNRAYEEMKKGTSPVCIDNTNLEAWEMKAYVVNADKLKYKTHLIKTSTPWALDPEQLVQKTQTGISKKLLVKKLKKYDQDVRIADIRSSIPMR